MYLVFATDNYYPSHNPIDELVPTASFGSVEDAIEDHLQKNGHGEEPTYTIIGTTTSTYKSVQLDWEFTEGLTLEEIFQKMKKTLDEMEWTKYTP